MDFLNRLIHDDMFLAVVSYLSIGVAFLLYFYYREKKWESDLRKYEIKPVSATANPQPPFRPGTVTFNSSGSGSKIVATVRLNEEMQVIEGIPLEPEKPPTAVRSDAGTGAKILPFRPVRPRATAASQQRLH